MSESIAPTTATGVPVDDRAELIETLATLLFQERLMSFVDELDEEDLVLFEGRMLEAKPVSFSALAAELGISERKAKARVRDLEARMRRALADPDTATEQLAH